MAPLCFRYFITAVRTATKLLLQCQHLSTLWAPLLCEREQQGEEQILRSVIWAFKVLEKVCIDAAVGGRYIYGVMDKRPIGLCPAKSWSDWIQYGPFNDCSDFYNYEVIDASGSHW